MTTDRGDRRPGAQQRGQVRVAAQRQCHEVLVAEITHGGDTADQGRARQLPCSLGELLVGQISDLFLQGAVAVENEVLMAVDDAGHQRDVTEIRDRTVETNVVADGDDRAALDLHQRRVDESHTIEQRCSPENSRGSV